MRYLIILFLFIGCTKEVQDQKPTIDWIPQTVEEEFLIANYEGLRTGIALPIFFEQSFTMDNFLEAFSDNYLNEQIAFNKDSVTRIDLKRYDGEVVNIGGANYHGVYQIEVHFMNPNINYAGIVFAKDSSDLYSLYPAGVNHAKGINQYLTLRRSNAVMNYYDLDFFKWKNKYSYNINHFNSGYRDWLASKKPNSTVYRLNHQ